MSDWLTDGGSWYGNLGREIQVQLGIRDLSGNKNPENLLVLAMEDPILRTPRVVLKALVEVPISLGRDARELVNSGAEVLRELVDPGAEVLIDSTKSITDPLVIKTEEPFLRLAEKFHFNPKAVEARYLAHLIDPLKHRINIVDVIKAVESGKLIPTLVINNSEPTESKIDDDKLWQRLRLPNFLQKPKEKIKEKNETLFLETPNSEHKLTLSYKPPSKDSELGELNIQFKGSKHKHLLVNCTEPEFQRFVDFLVDHPDAQKIENNSQLTK
jgi:hypothetical protein